MPELPEVETVRRGLEQKLQFFIIKRIEVLRPSTIAFPKDKNEFISGLNNSLIDKWNRRGKYLIADLKKSPIINEPNLKGNYTMSNGFLVIHLRMTGHFNWLKESKSPCKHTRISFFDQNKNELRYIDVRSFGKMWWIKAGESPYEIIKGLGGLGPEPFSRDFNTNYFYEELSRRRRSIKSILLDQTIIAGIGNIYADESLFEAGISPFREGNKIKIKEISKLRTSIINVLKKSIGSGGTSFSDFRNLEGSNGNYSLQANVYRRTGKQCHKCKNTIEKGKIAGRSTHWCRKCQK